MGPSSGHILSISFAMASNVFGDHWNCSGKDMIPQIISLKLI
jgi:hypothetical protein